MDNLEALGGASIVTEIVIQARDEAAKILEDVMVHLEQVNSATTGMNEKLEQAGAAFGTFAMGVAAATAGVVSWGVTAAEQFQHNLDVITSFAQGSTRYMELYRTGVIDIANQTGNSTEEIAADLAKVVEAQYRGADALRVTTNAEMAAIGARVQTTQVMQPLIDVMRTWNLTAAQSRNVTDSIIVGARDAGGEFMVLNRALAISGTTAHALGDSYQDLIGVTDALSAGGTKIYQSGRQVYTLFQTLQARLQDTNPVARQLGVTLSDLGQKHIQGIVPQLEALNNAFDKAAKGSVSQYRAEVQALLGTGPAYTAFTQLAANGFAKLTMEMNHQADATKGVGAAQDAYRAAQETMSRSVETFHTRLETVAVQLGTAFLPALTAVTVQLSNGLEPLGKWIFAHQQLTEYLLGSVIALGALAGALKVVHELISPFTTLYEAVGNSVRALSAEWAKQREEALKTASDTIVSGDAQSANSIESSAKVVGSEEAKQLAMGNTGRAATEEAVQVAASNAEQIVSETTTTAQIVAQQRLRQESYSASQLQLMGLPSKAGEATVALEGTSAAVADVGVVGEGVAADAAGSGGILAMLGGLGSGAEIAGAALVGIVGVTSLVGIALIGLGAATYIAYEKWPAFHTAVDNLADALGGKLYNYSVLLSRAWGDLKNKGDALLVTLGRLNSEGGKSSNWLRDNIPGAKSLGDAWGDLTGKAGHLADVVTRGNKDLLALGGPGVAVTPFKMAADAVGNWSDHLNGAHVAMMDSVHGMDDLRAHAALLVDESHAKWKKWHDDVTNQIGDVNSQYALLMASFSKQAVSGVNFQISGGQQQSSLEGAIRAFPASIQGVMQPVLNDFAQKLGSERTTYMDQIHKENTSYFTQMHDMAKTSQAAADAAINKGGVNAVQNAMKIVAAFDKAGEKLTQIHNAHIAGFKQVADQHVQGIRDAMKALTNPGALFAKALSQATSVSANDVNALAGALVKGKGNFDNLTEAAVRAGRTLGSLTDAHTKAALLIARAAGDMSAVIQITTQGLQTKVNEAQARYDNDQATHTGNLKADAAALLAAGKALDVYTKAHNASTQILASASATFASKMQAAGQLATDALGRLAQGIMDGSHHLGPLKESAIQAAEESLKYADAQKKAAAIVAQATGDFATKLSLATQAATDHYNKELAIAAEQIRLHGHVTESVREALERARKGVDDFTNSMDKAKKIGQPTDFASVQQRAGTEAGNEMNALETAILHGHGNIEKLALAAADGEKWVRHLSQIQEQAAVDIAHATGTWTQAVADHQKRLIDAANTASINLDHAIRSGASNIEKLAEKSAKAQQALQDFNDGTIRGNIATAKAAHNYVAVWDEQGKLISEKMSKAVGLAAQEIERTGYVHQNAADQMEAAFVRQEKIAMKREVLDEAENTALHQAAVAVGDFAMAISTFDKQAKTDLQNGTNELVSIFEGSGGDMQHALGLLAKGAQESETELLANRKATELVTQAEIKAAIAAGDLQTAWEKSGQEISQRLTGASEAVDQWFLTPVGSLDDLIATYKQAKADQDAHNAAMIKGAEAVGDFSAAITGIGNQLSENLKQATDKLALDFYNTGQASEADIAAAQNARIASEKLTQAQWDAAYATASASEKTKMLDQRFSDLISRNSTIQGAQGAVDNARLAELAAEGAVQIALLQQQVVATNGLVSVMSAQTAVDNAIGSAAVSAISDQTNVMKAESSAASDAINSQITLLGDLKSGNQDIIDLDNRIAADTARVDAEQIALAKLQAAANAAASAQAIQLSKDQLRQAQDKASADNAAAQWASTLAQDHLVEARAQTKLALDQQALTLDQLAVLDSIDSNIAGVNEFGTMIQDDLDRLNSDQAAILKAQQQLQADQQAASLQAVQDAQQQASDSLTIGQDNATAAAVKQNYDLQIAALQQKIQNDTDQKTRDEDQKKLLQAIAQNTGVTAASDQQKLDAAKATVQMLEKELLRRRIGLDRTSVVNTGEADYLSGWSSAAYGNGGLPSA